MHGFSGRQAQTAHWKEGQQGLGTLPADTPADEKNGETLAQKAAAELAWDAEQVAAAQS